MNPFKRLKEFFSSMEDETKARLRLLGAVLAAAFALFTLVSVVSYFFTWKADQSLLTDPGMMSQSVSVRNWGGKAGYSLAHFLVGDCFGIGSLVFVFFIGLLSWKLFRKDGKGMPILKALALTLAVCFTISFLLGFISNVGSLGTAFGGGLGGACGRAAAAWSVNLFGMVLTAVLVLILAGGCALLAGFKVYSGDEPELPPEPSGPSGTDIDEPAPWESPVRVPEPVPASDPYPCVIEPDGSFADAGPEEPDGEDVPDVDDVDGGLEIITDDTLNAPVRKKLERIDIRDELPGYRFPTLDLLGDHSGSKIDVSPEELSRNNNKIRATLANYNIKVNDVKAVVGPTVTLYKVYPAPGVKISTIRNLQEDIAMSLSATGVRVVNLPDSVGIEVANDVPSIVPLKMLLNDDEFRNSKAELPVAIGYTITQRVKVFDLADAPHLLVAGATKQGKSVGLNVIVSSLLYSKHPTELKFVFIDPKMVEFSSYGRLINHYLAVLPSAVSEQEEKDQAIVKNAKSAAAILQSLCIEMDQRYELLSKAVVNNIKSYNEKFKDRHLLPTEGHRFLPYLVVVVDEYADLTMSVGAGPESKALARGITTSVIRLAQKGRAAGIHVILATQRPTVDVVTGLIKTNFPMRIAFRVTSRIDSATILDSPGAEKLIGRGDMLLYSGIDMERVQCAFISNDEILALTKFIEDQKGYRKSFNTPYYLPEPVSDSSDDGGSGGSLDSGQLDERFEEAARLIVSTQRGSTSDIQRRLGMGYAKAGRVMDQLERAGIVGPQEGSKPRQVLVKDFNELNEILSRLQNG